MFNKVVLRQKKLHRICFRIQFTYFLKLLVYSLVGFLVFMFGNLAIFKSVCKTTQLLCKCYSQNAGCSFISVDNKDNGTREISTEASNKAV